MATDDEVPPGTENTAPTQDAEATDEVDEVAAAVRAATGVAKARFSERFESLGHLRRCTDESFGSGRVSPVERQGPKISTVSQHLDRAEEYAATS